MSLCQRGQVLLTKEAMIKVKGQTNRFTSKDARFACMGLYKFKGVKAPQEIYSVGVTIESLQPPKGSDKVKRLGGPKKIRKRARDRAIMDWVAWVFWRAGIVAAIFWVYLLLPILASPSARSLIGLPYDMPWVDWSVKIIKRILDIAGLS